MEHTDLTLMSLMQRYSTEEAARECFEQIRWPDGPYCPHCGNCEQDRIYKLTANRAKKARPGLYKCGYCRKSFTVTVNTVMERSKIPLRKWLWAWYIMCASKTQVSALQLQRQLEIGSYRSAWFMCHRIRFGMKDFGTHTPPMTGTVEADEMYVGGKVKGKGRRYTGNKTAVVSMVQRGGRVYSEVMPKVNGREVDFLLKQRVAPEAHLNTDESKLYSRASRRFASHDTVNHGSEEWSRHDAKTGRVATTNTVEGFFGNVKRSLDGTHHHVSGKYLGLYLAEQDHKYNTRKVTDGTRTAQGILMAEDKRLMFRGPAKA
ncbi:hypothetical protein LCGC14_0334700 [marine sediment metagenome]|uniref:ISXO2-like transposase domain-containing protein n=1 Tax=marine sediment metagenome TaxID=412755 RepID=A0A0F9TYC1_9ZZZZ